MNNRMIFVTLAATALFASACSTGNTPANEGNAIEFRTLIDKNAASRASLVDETDDLTSFFVVGGLADVATPSNVQNLDFMQSAVWRTVTGGGSIWNYAPKKYFPADGTTVNFYAYAPIKDVNMGDDAELSYNPVSFNYTVPNDQSESNTAVDLLVANASGSTSTTSPVAFAFNHALSGVTFSAKNNNPETSELVYTISGIEISGLANEGTFTYPFSAASWDVTGSPVIYKPGLPASGVTLMPHGIVGTFENLLSANDVMMVLPQQIEGGSDTGILDSEPTDWDTNSYLRVTFSLKDGEGVFINQDSKLYLPLPDPFVFAPGTLYNFQFQFKESAIIEFTVSALTGWVRTEQTLP